MGDFYKILPLVLLFLCNPAFAILKATPTEVLLLSEERMGLQALESTSGIWLLGGFSYTAKACSRTVSLISTQETKASEVTTSIQMAVDRNHFRAVSLSLDKALVMGGYSESYGSLANIELLNLKNGAVDVWPGLKIPVELFSVYQMPDRVAVIGGLTAQGLKTRDTIQLIDLKTKEVSVNSQKLGVSRFGHESIWLPKIQKLLIVGGKNVTRGAAGPDGKRPAVYRSVKELELWDPQTGKVEGAGSLTIGRDRPALSILPDGKVLVVGGASETAAPQVLGSIELYDPVTSTSKIVGQMTVGRMASKILSYLDRGVIIAGGWVENSEAGKAIEYFDFASQSVRTIGQLASSRAEHQMLWVSPDRFILIGGKNVFGTSDPAKSEFRLAEIFKLTEREDTRP